MKLILIISVFFMFSCREVPQPINYGKDVCSECKMTAMDSHFGAEIVTHKGKVYKFDDIVCMVQFMNSGEIKKSDVDKMLVANYEKQNDLLDVENAVFFVGDDMHSPMGSNTAAFKTKAVAENFKKNKSGIVMSWNEISMKLN